MWDLSWSGIEPMSPASAGRFLTTGPRGKSYLTCLDFLLPTRPWASLVAQTIKNLPAMQKTQVQSLGQEDPLEKGMTAHSSILAWRTPWTEEPGEPQSMVSQRVGHYWATTTYIHTPGPRVLTSSSDSSRQQSKSLSSTLSSSFLLFSSQPSCPNGPQTEWLTLTVNQGLQSCRTSSWHALKYWVTALRVWRGITVNYLHVQDWCWT